MNEQERQSGRNSPNSPEDVKAHNIQPRKGCLMKRKKEEEEEDGIMLFIWWIVGGWRQ